MKLYNLSASFSAFFMLVAPGLLLAEESPTLLTTAGASSASIEFLAGDSPVTGIQFDFLPQAGKSGFASTSLEQGDSICLVGVPDTHQVICGKQPDGSIRAIVFSGSNAILKTGELGIIKGFSDLSFVPDSVIASDPAANKVEVQMLDQLPSDVKRK